MIQGAGWGPSSDPARHARRTSESGDCKGRNSLSGSEPSEPPIGWRLLGRAAEPSCDPFEGDFGSKAEACKIHLRVRLGPLQSANRRPALARKRTPSHLAPMSPNIEPAPRRAGGVETLHPLKFFDGKDPASRDATTTASTPKPSGDGFSSPPELWAAEVATVVMLRAISDCDGYGQ